MVILVHQKHSSSPQSNAAAAAVNTSPSPSSVSAGDRRWCSRWSRLRAILTAVFLCTLTALFIQQSQYAKRWKPAIPLGIEDNSHSSDNSGEYNRGKTSELKGKRLEKTKLFKENLKNRSKKLATKDIDNEIHIKETIDGNKRDAGLLKEATIKNLPQKYRGKRPSLPADLVIENVASDGDASGSPQTVSEFTSPLIVTEKDWPLNKHLVPIPLNSALGMRSSKETSSTRPIKVAYIRFCKQDDPQCVEQKPMNFAKRCPYPGLEKTDDWNTADIVVISVWRIRNEQYVPSIRRPPGQIWIMLSVEAPSRKQNHLQLDYPGIKGQFNLTMSYRLDADIPYPYGHLQKSSVPDERDLEAVYSAKRFQVAWLVSHCKTNSRRENYVNLLQKAGLEVHIYGSCGNYSCQDGRRKKRSIPFAPDSVCMPHLSNNYFFYLSFENAMCKDYMTEKVFKIFDSVDLIPVVMGGSDYNKFLPPRTFVNAADFRSARSLAKYLKRLASDKRRYLRMLREKNKWQRVPRQPWYCTLGEKLATGLTPKVLPDTRSWYSQDQCWKASEFQ